MAQLCDEIISIKDRLHQELIQSNKLFGAIITKEFVSKGSANYLIEIPQSIVGKVPADWECLSAWVFVFPDCQLRMVRFQLVFYLSVVLEQSMSRDSGHQQSTRL